MSRAESLDIDDLIGDLDDAPKGPPVVVTSYKGAEEAGVSLELSDVHAGVTVTWLASVFGMGINTVHRKLADCPPLKKHKATKVYDLRQAAAYLVDPKVDLERYIKTLQPGDMPARLQKDYWDALLKRQKWELEAGQLWRSEDVLAVLGDAFGHIKSSMQLWAVTLERKTGLTTEQRELLTVLCDKLLDSLHEKLVSMPSQKRTPNIRELHELEDGSASAPENSDV